MYKVASEDQADLPAGLRTDKVAVTIAAGALHQRPPLARANFLDGWLPSGLSASLTLQALPAQARNASTSWRESVEPIWSGIEVMEYLIKPRPGQEERLEVLVRDRAWPVRPEGRPSYCGGLNFQPSVLKNVCSVRGTRERSLAGSKWSFWRASFHKCVLDSVFELLDSVKLHRWSPVRTLPDAPCGVTWDAVPEQSW